MDKIKQFLDADEPEYSTGLALLLKYSKNRGLHARLSRKPWPEKLKYELKKIYTANTNVKALAEVKKTDPEKTPEQIAEESGKLTYAIEKVETQEQLDNLVIQLKELVKPLPEEAQNKMIEFALSRAPKFPTQEELEAKEKAEEIINDAETTAEETIEDAQTTADEIIEDANSKADDILQQILDKKGVTREMLPPSLRDRYDENTLNYKLMRSKHEKLKLMKDDTDEKRAPLCQELAALGDKVTENWAVIDAWDGKPIVEAVVSTPTAKDVSNARSYISKNKDKIALGDAKREAYLNKVQDRVNIIITAGEEFEQESIDELKSLGITFE